MFDPRRAYHLANSLSYPRLSGSDGSRRAIQEIRTILGQSGIPTQELPFRISYLPTSSLQVFLVAEACLFGVLFAWPGHSLIALAFLIYGCLLATVPRWIELGQTLGLMPSQITGRNILTDPVGTGNREILFVAHHDTKSQSVSIVTRILTFGCLCLLHAYAVTLLFLSAASGTIQAVAAVGVMACGILITLRYRNDTPGALDNASGVAVCLALAERARKGPTGRAKIRFLFTDAEEWGLQGAHHYVTQTAALPWAVVNVDSVGAGERLWFYGARCGLMKGLRRSARMAGLRCVHAWMPFGMLADQVPFVRAGWDAVTVTSLSADLRRLHTKRDSVSSLNIASFAAVDRLFDHLLRDEAE